MRKRSYISSEEFSEKYNTEINHILVFKTQLKGEIPKGLFSYSNKRKMYVDEIFFDTRIKFQKRIWLESHDYYYYFSKHLGDYPMARMVAEYYGEKLETWSFFVATGLFTPLHTSVFRYKTNIKLWKFYRAVRHIYRELHHKKGVKPPPPSFYLDREMMSA